MTNPIIHVAFIIIGVAVLGANGKIGGWDPSVQYHIQTDEGNERFFKYQTVSGQYRKEKRLQDGSVVGSYGWVDADGYLRLSDYVADDKGYRVVRSRMLRIGHDTPIDNVIKGNRKQVTQAPIASPPTTPLPPISLSDYLKGNYDQVKVTNNGYSNPSLTVQVSPNSYTTATTNPLPTIAPNSDIAPVTFRPRYHPNSVIPSSAAYDGIAFTNNGFRYYLPRHYHREDNLGGGTRAGSFGYIDPFGIRRVIYYNTSPGSGFLHTKNNKYVGFNATPYDPTHDPTRN